MLGNWSSLGLVGVKEARPSPAAQDPSELPGEVVAVVNGRVHPGSSPGSHAVGGVADEEDVLVSEAVCNLGARRERRDLLELERKIGHACPARISAASRSSEYSARWGPSAIAYEPVPPPIFRPRRQEDPRGASGRLTP